MHWLPHSFRCLFVVSSFLVQEAVGDAEEQTRVCGMLRARQRVAVEADGRRREGMARAKRPSAN